MRGAPSGPRRETRRPAQHLGAPRPTLSDEGHMPVARAAQRLPHDDCSKDIFNKKKGLLLQVTLAFCSKIPWSFESWLNWLRITLTEESFALFREFRVMMRRNLL